MQIEVILLPNEVYVCNQNREDYLSGVFFYCSLFPCHPLHHSHLSFVSVLHFFADKLT